MGYFENFIITQLSKKLTNNKTTINKILTQYISELNNNISKEVGTSIKDCIEYSINSPSIVAYFKSSKLYYNAGEACKYIDFLAADIYKLLTDNIINNIDINNDITVSSIVKACKYDNEFTNLIANMIYTYYKFNLKYVDKVQALTKAIEYANKFTSIQNSFLISSTGKYSIADKNLVKYFDNNCTNMYKKLSPDYYNKALTLIYYAIVDTYKNELMPLIVKFLPNLL